MKRDPMKLNKEEIAKLKDIYEEAVTFFSGQTGCSVNAGFDYAGFKILNTQPEYMPPLFFIGYQPGGDADHWKEERRSESYKTWPAKNECLEGDWSLANRMQEMFGAKLEGACASMQYFVELLVWKITNSLLIGSPVLKSRNFVVLRLVKL
jgi:hypothetical protein